jgi:hypothetical protein
VVAGTATAVSNRVSRRQADRWSAQDDQAYYEQQQQYAPQQPAPAPPAGAGAADPYAQLKEFSELHSQGILTDAEFEAQKAKILNS